MKLLQCPPRQISRRTFDIVLAGTSFVVMGPLCAGVAAAIWWTDGTPILFRHTRVGLKGRLFRLCKFRTMIPDAESKGPAITIAADRRVTQTGRWLRRYKLDELPQLWNVLVGDMSMVGARPETPCFVDTADTRWTELLSARPGLTDPATLAFRDEEALLAGQEDQEQFYRESVLPAKLDLSLKYQQTRTLLTDTRVLALTLLSCLRPGATASPGLVDRIPRETSP